MGKEPKKFISLRSRRTPSVSPTNLPAVSIETIDGPREIHTLEAHPISINNGKVPKSILYKYILKYSEGVTQNLRMSIEQQPMRSPSVLRPIVLRKFSHHTSPNSPASFLDSPHRSVSEQEQTSGFSDTSSVLSSGKFIFTVKLIFPEFLF